MRVLPRYSYSREVANYIFTPVINEGCKWSLRISLTTRASCKAQLRGGYTVAAQR
jgi:hypothetical protein